VAGEKAHPRHADYISPEQMKCLPVDGAYDVFNFGATMYGTLTTAAATLFT